MIYLIGFDTEDGCKMFLEETDDNMLCAYEDPLEAVESFWLLILEQLNSVKRDAPISSEALSLIITRLVVELRPFVFAVENGDVQKVMADLVLEKHGHWRIGDYTAKSEGISLRTVVVDLGKCKSNQACLVTLCDFTSLCSRAFQLEATNN